MSRARNAVIIIILFIIAAYSVKKGPQLALLPANAAIKDAVAANDVRRGGPKLTLAGGAGGEELRDAVAGHAAGTPNYGGTLGDVAPPPRGYGAGGIGTQSNDPGQNFAPPPVLSPSGPADEPPSND